MIIGGFGDLKEHTDVWLAGLGAKWVGRGPRAEVWVAHTGAPLECHFAGTDLLVVAESRLVHDTRAANDAEVIAAAYRSSGLDCVARLRGRFSFVLYDGYSGLLVGTSGITSRRPLAYWSHRDATVVGSRLLPLLRHPGAPRADMDDTYIAHAVLGYCAAPGGTTPIRRVRRLPAGVALVVRHRSSDECRVDSLARKPLPSTKKATDAFWEAVENAVKETTRMYSRPCLALSGGLDSAAVATAVARVTPSFGAFSMVAPRLAPAESHCIDGLERTWPGMRLERIDSSCASAYPDLTNFALRDDPPLVPLTLLPARFKLWSAARRAGFDAVIDGEGGDELFGLYVTPLDAFRRGDWLALLSYLWSRPDRRSIALRSVLLPLSPSVVRRRWATRWAQGASGYLPSYLLPAATGYADLKEAAARFYGAWIHRPALDLVEDWLSSPTSVGSLGAHVQLAREFGLELVSPLLDRELVELILGLQPSMMLSQGLDKRFLREALAARIPEGVRTEAKDESLSSALGWHIVTSRGARASLQNPSVRDRFARWIRFDKFEALLDAIEAGHRPGRWVYWQVESLITLCDWYVRASREYGVQ